LPKHRRGLVDAVAVAASLAFPLDEPGLDQVGQDPLGRPDGDADRLRDVAQAHVRVARDAEQHLRVVGHELPAAALVVG